MFNQETNTQKNWNDFFQNEKSSSNIHIIPLFVIIIIICLVSMLIFFARDKEPVAVSTQNFANINSNRDGLAMASSISILELIMAEDFSSYTKEELQVHIDTISYLGLSTEYDDLRQKMTEKLNYYIDYLDSGNEADLEKYNSIDFNTELASAFDAAGVKYEYKDGKIEYEYKEY